MSENIYKKTRNRLRLTRDEVCDKALLLNKPLQPERLERVENGRFDITPEEVMLLSEIYAEPTLCNHYCSKDCPIGQKYVPEIKLKDLSQIVLEMLSSLNTMKKRQDRLIEISANGIIEEDEINDFISIQKDLEKISVTVETLQFWAEEMIAERKIDIDKYNALKNG